MTTAPGSPPAQPLPDATATPPALSPASPPLSPSAVGPTSPPVPELPAIILAPVEERIAHCRAASVLAHRLGDEIAGFAPAAAGPEQFPLLIEQLRQPLIEPLGVVALSADGSVSWTADGRCERRSAAPEALQAAAAALLNAATRRCDAMGVLASDCLVHLAAEGEPRLQVVLIAQAFQACDGVDPGWGRWAAALTAAVLADAQWRRYGRASRRDVSLLLWQCGYDAHDAAALLQAGLPEESVPTSGGVRPSEASITSDAPKPSDVVGDAALQARRYYAAWGTCCELLSELGGRMTAAVLTHLSHSGQPSQAPPP